jgi:phage N-6-adenine-methyltransferase
MRTNLANKKQLAYTGSLQETRVQGAASADNWFTPEWLTAEVRFVLSGIALDPFSSEAANALVGAQRILTKEDNAVECQWPRSRTVFMNPPYSRGLADSAALKFLREWGCGTFVHGCVLLNNVTETQWFQALFKQAARVCFFKGRISFVSRDNKRMSGNTRGQTMMLFSNSGRIKGRFTAVFGKYGVVTKTLL